MMKQVSMVISKRKTVDSILINLQPIQRASAQARTRPSFPSGAGAENLTVGAMFDERRKIEEEIMRKRGEKAETQRSSPR